ncbi:MAG: hypothetical protein CMF62_02485 [Magnetococcales bacterium]|nr:hypothetical protein [Magnetococcales bacterium]|tara:strand:- start:9527 stop:11839 length:2313 start_codon:yes stop_codon:yes gene_type:complete
MDRNKNRTRYIDLKINGRLFPSWIMANYKKYKIPPLMRKDDDDPCNRKTKNELRSYQIFLSKYLDFRSPYRDMLIYHGMGSGKTATTINIYNVLYNYTPGWNVFLLIKASLKDDPWLDNLKKWLSRDEYEFRMRNIIFVHYDSPFADRDFLEAVRKADSSKKSIFIIEEAHNFISNVYSNISSQQGKRASVIYDYIQQARENDGTRVLALSATPAINQPFELALLFNLLRPGSMPKSEAEFNQLYITNASYRTMNKTNKNMFQRRILGLVTYYLGATPDYFARKVTTHVDVTMSDYQNDIYTIFEEKEQAIAKKMKYSGKQSGTYKSYTRSSCNFVFPQIDQNINGEGRPRPGNFRITEREAKAVDTGKGDRLKAEKGTEKFMRVNDYEKALKLYIDGFENYLREADDLDRSKKYTIKDDFEKFKTKYNANFEEFVKNEKQKSNLFNKMHECSAKMTNMMFIIETSPGPVLVYSNYVLMEGLQIFKIYMKYFGILRYSVSKKNAFMEYHGGINRKERKKQLELFNQMENKRGELYKVIMVSQAGSEGLNLLNVRQVHILEPYWHEVRITQMIGRAIRLCSHRDLPMEEREVQVFRYKSVRKEGKMTTDEYIEELARSKDGLIQSFLEALKEVAVDCQLNSEVNMMSNEYKCFQFDEPSLFDRHIGPAYKEDLKDDMKMDNGSNSTNSKVIKIKVVKIQAVKLLSNPDEPNPKYSKSDDYWYYSDSGVVYDFEMKFPVGKVAIDETNIPVKTDKNTYLIDQLVPIPLIEDQ